jgi:hypothetical protein
MMMYAQVHFQYHKDQQVPLVLTSEGERECLHELEVIVHESRLMFEIPNQLDCPATGRIAH